MSRHEAILRAIERIALRGINEPSYTSASVDALYDIRLIAEELRRGETRTWTAEQLREEAGAFACQEHRNNGRRYLAAFIDWLAAEKE